MSGLRNAVMAGIYLGVGYEGAVHVTMPLICDAAEKDPWIRNLTTDLRQQYCPGVIPVPVDAGVRDIRLALPARVMKVERMTFSGYDQERKLAGISLGTADSKSFTESTGWLTTPSYRSVLGQETPDGKRVFNDGSRGIDVSTLHYISDLAIPIAQEPQDVMVAGCGPAEDVTGNDMPAASCRREGLHESWNNGLPLVSADRNHNVGQRQRALSEIATQDIFCLFRHELEPALEGPKTDAMTDEQRDTEAAKMIIRTHVRIADYLNSNGANLPWNTGVVVIGNFDVGPSPTERYASARATDPGLPEKSLTADDFCVTGGSSITIPQATLNVYKALGDPVVDSSYNLQNSDFQSVIADYRGEG